MIRHIIGIGLLLLMSLSIGCIDIEPVLEPQCIETTERYTLATHTIETRIIDCDNCIERTNETPLSGVKVTCERI